MAGRRFGVRLSLVFVVAFAVLFVSPVRSGSQASRRSGAGAVHEVKKAPAREMFVGDAACRSCHEKEFVAYGGTAHHLTSRPADAQSIAGPFSAGANVMKTSNPALTFRMTADAGGFYQTAVEEVAPGRGVELTQPIDIVVGSGHKAQTYLYWKADQLFELPVSFWVSNGAWVNSPGYVDGAIRFDRPIYPRCLECHGDSFRSLAPPANRFEKASVVFGITCERCHGPGREHVAFYDAHPATAGLTAGAQGGAGDAHGMLKLASLPRARQIDACAICHAGLGTPLAPALSFQPGEALERYLHLPPTSLDAAVDVHGNQVQLLESSRCFQKSQMTCTTCHNVHQVQRDAAAFSQTCLGCHQARQCGKFHTMGEAITKDCVSCHMPLRRSTMLFSETNDQTLQLPVRDHRIAVYGEGGR